MIRPMMIVTSLMLIASSAPAQILGLSRTATAAEEEVVALAKIAETRGTVAASSNMIQFLTKADSSLRIADADRTLAGSVSNGFSFSVKTETSFAVRHPLEITGPRFVPNPKGDRVVTGVSGHYVQRRANATHTGEETVLQSTGSKNIRNIDYVSTAEDLELAQAKMGSEVKSLAQLQVEDTTEFINLLEIPSEIPRGDLTKYAEQLYTFNIPGTNRSLVPTARLRTVAGKDVIEVTYTTTPREALQMTLATTTVEGARRKNGLSVFKLVSMTTKNESSKYDLQWLTREGESKPYLALVVKNLPKTHSVSEEIAKEALNPSGIRGGLQMLRRAAATATMGRGKQ